MYFFIRCFFGTVWESMSILFTEIACNFSQFYFLCENCLRFFFCRFLFLFPLTYFIPWKFRVLVSCALFFIIPESSCQLFFIISAANIKSLWYWLFFIEFWIVSPFDKLAYFDWYEFAVNRYAIHLLNSSDLIFLLSSAHVTLLNSLRFYT